MCRVEIFEQIKMDGWMDEVSTLRACYSSVLVKMAVAGTIMQCCIFVMLIIKMTITCQK